MQLHLLPLPCFLATMQLLAAAWLLVALLCAECANGNVHVGQVRALAAKSTGLQPPRVESLLAPEEEPALRLHLGRGLLLRGGRKTGAHSAKKNLQPQRKTGHKIGGGGKAKRKEEKKKAPRKSPHHSPIHSQRTGKKISHSSERSLPLPLHEDPAQPLSEEDGGNDNDNDNDDADNSDNAEDDGASVLDNAASDLDAAPLNGKAAAIRSIFSGFFSKTPPMTLMYLTSSIALTILCFLLNQNYWPDFLTFSWSGLTNFQLWRLLTGFLFLGGLDLFYPLTLQFVWQHMSYLEKMNYKSPEDFLVLVLFGMASLIGVYSFLGISMRYLGHNLATYLVYIWSKVLEGMDVNFMDLFLLKAELLPWFFCVQTYLLEQQIPWADLIGILVGHGYWYLRQKRLLVAPESWKAFFRQPFWQHYYQQYKAEFE